MNYSKNWKDGVYFLNNEFGVTSNLRDSRGFFLVCGEKHLYVFCRYTHLFDHAVYSKLLDEFKHFEQRSKTISELGEIASLSQEWEQLAATQRSFLPQQMPDIPHLDIAAYFRPLVNVSGDYYTVLPMDKNKTHKQESIRRYFCSNNNLYSRGCSSSTLCRCLGLNIRS